VVLFLQTRSPEITVPVFVVHSRDRTSSLGFVVKVTDSCLENQSLVITVTHMSYWWQQEWHPAEFAEPDL